MALIKCPECGKEISSTALTCPNCGYSNNHNDGRKIEEKSNFISTMKLTLGLVSIAVFIVVSFRSLTLGLATTTYTDEIYNGFICAALMLVGGLISISTKKSKSITGTIVIMIFYIISFSVTIGTGKTTYSDLPLWGLLALAFAIVNFIMIFLKKKNHI